MNVNKIREDFTILNNPKNKLVYFDSACMSLKPRQVVDKINEYYNNYPACAGRSNHRLSQKATEEYNQTRKSIQKLINAKSDKNIIFTRNTTEGINIISKSLNYDVVITTDKEHNSNHVPWIVSKKTREIIKTPINYEELKKIFEKHKGKNILVSIVQTSNLDGTEINVKEITKLSHDYNAKVMIDGAQSVPHRVVDVKKLDVDFLAFSGHKMLGPTGTGILYGKEELLKNLKPYNTGGDTVKDTFYDRFEFEDIPEKFEAGLQDYSGIIGLGEAANYLRKYLDEIHDHEIKLNTTITEGLRDHVKILGPKDAKDRSGIFSFTSNMNHHELALMLDKYSNILVRSGRHCVHSWLNANNIDGTTRASLYIYNTNDEAKYFVDKTKEILKIVK